MAENYKHLYEQMKKMVAMYQDEIVPSMRKQLENRAEVVHGRWIKTETNSTCSACGANVISWSGEYDGYEKERGICMMHYCPNCGALMDGVNEDV